MLIETFCVVGMNACSRVKFTWLVLREFQGAGAVRYRCPGDDKSRDAGCFGSRDDLIPIGVETVMREI